MKVQHWNYYIKNSLHQLYEYNEAKSITEWLLSDVLKFKYRVQVYEEKDYITSDYQNKLIQQKFKRLLRYEPIQYVIHKAWFCDLEFFVCPAVLIPRPETEELCYKILNEVNIPNASVLDIGTGSGCLAISLKKKRPLWQLVATDISKKAIKIASCNAKRHLVNVNFMLDDVLQTTIADKTNYFDVIVSNPPYIPESEKNKMLDNVVKYEPSIALFVPDDDPIVYYRAIMKLANHILKPNGSLYLEVHEYYADLVMQMFVENLWNTNIDLDIHGKKRFIKAQKNG
ncbi:MAG: peptide chain release factor N(5)-glutamine methyltransferase [Bacteroidales bacterium]|nr:peptide chain release factor N(5)-glutamine methyltransferase [Bacteroidales bacterium]